MKKGVVKFFNTDKMFGFITEEESGRDIFVHKTGLIDNIQEGDHVEYEEKEGPKGMNATNVKTI